MIPEALPEFRRTPGASKAAGAVVVLGLAGLVAATALIMRSGRAVSGRAVTPQRKIDRNLAAMRRVPPELLKWQEVQRLQVPLKDPRGVASDAQGSVYVAGDTCVLVYAARALVPTQIALDDAPRCVFVDGRRDIYLGFRKQVEVVGETGAVKVRWALPSPKSQATGIAARDREVYVADAGQRVVLRYHKSGRLLGRIGERDKQRKVPGLILPSPHFDVQPLPGGLLLVNNPGRRAVETYTPTGEIKGSWGKTSYAVEGFCGCCNPTDIAVLPDGKVVTSEKGLPRVKVYNPDGTLESVAVAPDDLPRNASGIDLATDKAGRILMLDRLGRHVRVLARKASAAQQGVSK